MKEADLSEEARDVALYMSAWIEIETNAGSIKFIKVALYMSAWIEIARGESLYFFSMSRTLYECVD
ncbi:MAG: hypothetical protein ACFWTY_05440 [Shouchella clausii]